MAGPTLVNRWDFRKEALLRTKGRSLCDSCFSIFLCGHYGVVRGVHRLGRVIEITLVFTSVLCQNYGFSDALRRKGEVENREGHFLVDSARSPCSSSRTRFFADGPLAAGQRVKSSASPQLRPEIGISRWALGLTSQHLSCAAVNYSVPAILKVVVVGIDSSFGASFGMRIRLRFPIPDLSQTCLCAAFKLSFRHDLEMFVQSGCTLHCTSISRVCGDSELSRTYHGRHSGVSLNGGLAPAGSKNPYVRRFPSQFGYRRGFIRRSGRRREAQIQAERGKEAISHRFKKSKTNFRVIHATDELKELHEPGAGPVVLYVSWIRSGEKIENHRLRRARGCVDPQSESVYRARNLQGQRKRNAGIKAMGRSRSNHIRGVRFRRK